eukprot:GFYU01007441.1.p1 GENE.GFYU01007441.1~~GFYU01007441.1.p1  ORF type:complete len:212 (+),score=56.22 GFYU01007441.1:53-637(+)
MAKERNIGRLLASLFARILMASCFVYEGYMTLFTDYYKDVFRSVSSVFMALDVHEFSHEITTCIGGAQLLFGVLLPLAGFSQTAAEFLAAIQMFFIGVTLYQISSVGATNYAMGTLLQSISVLGGLFLLIANGPDGLAARRATHTSSKAPPRPPTTTQAAASTGGSSVVGQGPPSGVTQRRVPQSPADASAQRF